MSEWFETVVDVDAIDEKTLDIAQAVLSELVRLRVVNAVATNCALGGLGYRPAEGVFDLLRERDDSFAGLRTNGLEIKLGRSIHVPFDLEYLACPSCHCRFTDTNSLAWGDAITAWYERSGGDLACPSCNRISPITVWIHVPNAAFGNLAFTFWNWPPFEPLVWLESPLGIIGRVTGHRCELVSGKL